MRLSRQLTGLSPQTRTPIEAEANRLGLTFAEVNPRTGEPKADRLIAREMAPIAERVLPRMLALPAYQQGTDAEKRVRWAVALRGIRSAAFRLAAKEDRKLFARIQVRRSVGRRERELLEERGLIYRLRGAWVPVQTWIDAGYFILHESTYSTPDGEEHLSSQTYVTGKGEIWLAKRLFATDDMLLDFSPGAMA